MTDYSQMSDFEINKAVAITIRPEIKNWVCYDISGRPVFVINENTPKRVQFGFSFISDPADAWPIIEENKISTMWMTSEKEWCAWSEGDLAEGTWDWENVPDYYFNCTSQLRAAMIVFLMMKDAENASAI